MTTVLCAGQAVADFVFYVDEMPTRAEKYRTDNAMIVGGGCAANAAVAIARLGGNVHLAAPLGADAVGDMIVAGLESENVGCTLIARDTTVRSAFSSVLIDARGERQIVSFRDDALFLGTEAPAADELMPFDAALGDTRWPSGAAAAMQAARKRGKPGVMDAEAPVAIASEALADASHVAFSEQGLRDFTGKTGIEAALAGAHAEIGGWICVTEGATGVRWLENGTIRHMPGFAIDVVDTLGAGDVWHGAFALALGEGRSEDGAIRFANAVAALKCTRPGGRAGAPSRADTEQFLKVQDNAA